VANSRKSLTNFKQELVHEARMNIQAMSNQSAAGGINLASLSDEDLTRLYHASMPSAADLASLGQAASFASPEPILKPWRMPSV
jgi:hypothetical protein